MSSVYLVDGSQTAVQKNFFSRNKKELLLVVAAVGCVAAGFFVSPDIGGGLFALSAFVYGASKLLCPAPSKLTRQEIEDMGDAWEVLSDEASKPASVMGDAWEVLSDEASKPASVERRKSIVVAEPLEPTVRRKSVSVVRPNSEEAFQSDPEIQAMFAKYYAENGIKEPTVAATLASVKPTEAKPTAATPAPVQRKAGTECWLLD